MATASRRTRRFALWLALCAALLPASWNGFAQPEAAAKPARAEVALALPVEYRAIRALDANEAASIPPSEVWPAQ